MPGLLVSVRSVEEARAAHAGGATVVDVKEPARGALGAADPAVWSSVRAVLPASVPVSVALGELVDWLDAPAPPPAAFAGLAFRKLGLAGTGPDWAWRWSELRASWGPGPAWIAVAYADWGAARAPDPDAVLGAALAAPECVGVLVDTWDKSSPVHVEPTALWHAWIARARRAGRTVALAGRLDLADFGRLASLAPDLYAVRGAACSGGDRLGRIDPERVARLARAALGVTESESGCRLATGAIRGRET